MEGARKRRQVGDKEIDRQTDRESEREKGKG